MKRPWIADMLVGFVLTGYVLACYGLRGAFPGGRFLETLELKAYDMRSILRQDLDPSSQIVLIAIDDDSIARLGRWPWPRTRIAEMIDLLAQAKPKVIGLNILYTEPEVNPAMAELENLKSKYLELVKSRKISQRGVQFEAEFTSATVRLDTDARLLASLSAAENLILPMFFTTGRAMGKPEELPEDFLKSSLTTRVRALVEGASPPVEGSKAIYPISAILSSASGVGHVNIYPDVDGVVRREVPAIKYGDRYFPSYALQLVIRSLGYPSQEATITPGQSVEIGQLRVPLDDSHSMLVTFNGPDHTFRYYSFYEVLQGKVSWDVFKDKIVLLGPSAAGIATLYVTPVAHSLPSIEFIANVIENILSQRFLIRPEWAVRLELGSILVIGFFLLLILPRLKALGSAVSTLVLAAALLGSGTYFFVERGEWVQVVYPTCLLVLGYLISVTRRFLVTEKGKELVEASAIETNKMLGLSFQGQGMLDLAFEKFRLCPLDENMKQTLYNLGLDFERKRQYAKAASVYQHIAAKDPRYQDIGERIKTLQAAAEGTVFGGVGAKSSEGTVLITQGASKPMLGRYEIIKELGRGAMGVVYLGKDPKIDRQVAIKTLMLEAGSSPEQAQQIKERFFREAQSAGTLNHPGIVRIYDAGEEQDVCYIAMELLEGQDLGRFTSKESLLEPAVAMDYVMRVAEALDYAHAQGIVHRDIKPANLMLVKDGSIRVADFGIARIAASSKTATGTVLGTPAYMSPEQVAGKKVDGRSDIFSLGVCLFEFLTGEKPFKGGEGIGTLLFQIANEPEPEPLELRLGLPPCVSRIIHKSLKKNPDERYQKGSEMAADLRSCLTALKEGKEIPPAALPQAPSAQTPAPAVDMSPAALALTAEEIARSLAPPEGTLNLDAEKTLNLSEKTLNLADKTLNLSPEETKPFLPPTDKQI